MGHWQSCSPGSPCAAAPAAPVRRRRGAAASAGVTDSAGGPGSASEPDGRCGNSLNEIFWAALGPSEPPGPGQAAGGLRCQIILRFLLTIAAWQPAARPRRTDSVPGRWPLRDILTGKIVTVTLVLNLCFKDDSWGARIQSWGLIRPPVPRRLHLDLSRAGQSDRKQTVLWYISGLVETDTHFKFFK